MAGLVRRSLIYEANTKPLHSRILNSDSFLWRLDGAEEICKRAMNNWKPLRRVKGALGHARRKDRETQNLWPSSERRKFFDFIAWHLHEKSFVCKKNRVDCGNFHSESSLHHFYFFPPWNLNSPVIGQWENIFPQIACSELAGFENRCHAMAFTLLRASCDCDVTFDIVLNFFRSFLQKLCKVMQFFICTFFSDRFPYYKSNDDRWKNSVRHNLSINPHFRKGNKAKAGAGHLWKISSRESEANFLAWEHVSIFEKLFLILSSYRQIRDNLTLDVSKSWS